MTSRLRVLIALTVAVACYIGSLAPSPAQAHTYSGNYVGPITFNTSDVLTAANLNQAINHVHNTFGNIVNAHIATNAAISHTKMANPALLPRAAGTFYETLAGTPANYTVCTSATCGISNSDRVTSVTRTGGAGAGIYSVTLAYTPANTNFGVIVTPITNTNHSCRAYDFSTSAPHFKIQCGAPADAAAQFIVLDYDN